MCINLTGPANIRYVGIFNMLHFIFLIYVIFFESTKATFELRRSNLSIRIANRIYLFFVGILLFTFNEKQPVMFCFPFISFLNRFIILTVKRLNKKKQKK